MALILPVRWFTVSVGRAGPGSVLCRLVLKKRTDPVQAAASAPAVAAPPAAVRVEAQVFLKCLEGSGRGWLGQKQDPLVLIHVYFGMHFCDVP